MRANLSEQERQILLDMYDKTATYLKAGRIDVAERTIKSYMPHQSLLPEIHNLLGLIFARQNMNREAVSEFITALNLDDNQLDAKLNLVVTLCDGSQYQDAIDFYEASIDQFKKVPELVSDAIAECHIATAKAYKNADMLAEAMTEYQKALSYQDYLIARLSLADIYIKLGYLDKAERELDQCQRQGIENSELSTLAGLIHLKRKRYPLAEDCFQNALKLDAANHSAKTYLAHLKSQAHSLS